ncbi:MAG: GlsB/YeaQ/YmgE family stress response membrane protein [Thermoleophilia bacterium]
MGVLFFILLAIVVFAIVGGAIMGILLHLIWWAIVGLLVGILARLLLKDSRRVGPLETILCGIGGALLGGVLAGLFDVGWFIELLLAIIVAALLIYAFGNTRRSGSGVSRTR